MGTVAAVASTGLGLFQAGSNLIGAEKTKKQIENFNRQEVKNPFEKIAIRTKKADQQTEAANLNFATSVDALRRTGTRGVLAGIPRITEANILLQNQISSDLENQERERDILIAQGDERVQNIIERREEQALQGLGQKLQTQRQDAFSGATNAIQSGLALSSSLSGSNNEGGNESGSGGTNIFRLLGGVDTSFSTPSLEGASLLT